MEFPYVEVDFVDEADYTVWRDALGSTTGLRANGDNTGNSVGVVDQADYAIWTTNFGNHTGGGTNAGAYIAEPATTLLAALGRGWMLSPSMPDQAFRLKTRSLVRLVNKRPV